MNRLKVTRKSATRNRDETVYLDYGPVSLKLTRHEANDLYRQLKRELEISTRSVGQNVSYQ